MCPVAQKEVVADERGHLKRVAGAVHTTTRVVIAAIAQAEALKRIADRLDLLCESGTGYGGEDIAVLRINAMR